MSWVRVYIHVVFTTKNKEPFLDTVKKRIKVFKHIKENALEKEYGWILLVVMMIMPIA